MREVKEMKLGKLTGDIVPIKVGVITLLHSVRQTTDKIIQKVNSTTVTVSDNKVALGDENATEPLVLGNELVRCLPDLRLVYNVGNALRLNPRGGFLALFVPDNGGNGCRRITCESRISRSLQLVVVRT